MNASTLIEGGFIGEQLERLYGPGARRVSAHEAADDLQACFQRQTPGIQSRIALAL